MPDPQRGTHRLGRRAKRFLSPSQKGGGHPVLLMGCRERSRSGRWPCRCRPTSSAGRISRTAQPAPSKAGVDMERGWEDAPAIPRGGSLMRYKVGAEQLQQVPTFVHRPDTAFRASRTAPAGPTHAVSTRTGEAACGIEADGLAVLDQDWEQAFFVEKCPGCFAAVLADTCD